MGISVKKVVEVHKFMLKEFEKILDLFMTLPNKESYDTKITIIVAQAIMGMNVEQKFGLTSDEIESAVLMYHTMLATDQEFANVNIQIQHAMGKLMGTPLSQTP